MARDKISARVETEFYDEVERYATQQGMSISEFLRNTVYEKIHPVDAGQVNAYTLKQRQEATAVLSGLFDIAVQLANCTDISNNPCLGYELQRKLVEVCQILS